MLLGVFEDRPAYRKFLILVSLVLFSTLLFSMIGGLLANYIYGVDIFTDPTALNNLQDPKVLAAMKLVQALSSGIGMFIVPGVVAAVVFSRQPVRYLQLNHKPPAIVNFLTILLMFMAVPAINFMLVLNQELHLPGFLSEVEKWMISSEENAARITEAFMVMHTPGDLMINLLIVAVLPAIGEEFLFRGVIQRLFTDLTQKPITSIVLSAVVFSALHMQFYGFVPRMALGILFGFLLLWSGSIWLPVLAHFINNGAAVVVAYINRDQILPFDQDTLGTNPGELPLLAVSIVAVFAICYLIKRLAEQKRPPALTLE